MRRGDGVTASPASAGDLEMLAFTTLLLSTAVARGLVDESCVFSVIYYAAKAPVLLRFRRSRDATLFDQNGF